MDNLLIYLLKVTAGTTLLYLTFLVFFRRDTFYLRNRILLILTLLLPLLFPLLKIPVTTENVVLSETLNEAYSLIPSEPATGSVLTTSTIPAPFDFVVLFAWIYLLVAGLLVLRGLISLTSTYSIIRKGVVKNNSFPIVLVSDFQHPPFSFFPYAVIPSKDYESGEYGDILDHEFAHIRQGHTFDLLLSELFIAFQWFNPFVWFIKRSVVLNHEYLADHISISKRSIKEYQYRLLNFNMELKNVSLAHTFNSLIKNRIIMINKKPTRKFAAWKNILVLPVVMIAIYAFATPEYKYITPATEPITIQKAPEIFQKGVRGIVLNEEGKPFEGVTVANTRNAAEAFSVKTGPDGRFLFDDLKEDESLVFFIPGYKRLIIKPDFSSEMTVKMEKDPEFNKSIMQTDSNTPGVQRSSPIVAIDGVITDKSIDDAMKDLGYDLGLVKMIQGKEAMDKYGDKGTNGVYDITTRKKALEMGLKPPFQRIDSKDYPTFQNERFNRFTDWVANNAIYPEEARDKKIEGWVGVNFKVGLDGSVTDVSPASGIVDPLLVNEIIRVIKTSPKWEPPKNSAVDEPFATSVTLKFKLPDQILNETPYVVVEKMPLYPGGDGELLKYIGSNTKYPESAKAEKAEGRVIIRFIVTKEGKAEGISILRSVHPLLDAEAVRVTSMLTGFEPGMQGGKPVDVWYMVPITFVLPKDATETANSLASTTPFVVVEDMPEFPGGSEMMLTWIAKNIRYPEEAFLQKEEGRVTVRFVVSPEGQVGELVVLKSDNPLFNEEALRVVSSMPQWKPGSQNGNKVPVYCMAPVEFRYATELENRASAQKHSSPYSILRKDGIVGTDISKINDSGNEIIIKYYEGTNLLINKYVTYGSSGKPFRIGNKTGFENVFFPFNLKLSKSSSGTSLSSRPDIDFECIINEPGKWEVTIRTNAEKFPMLHRDEEKVSTR